MRFSCALCWNEGKYNETYIGTYGLCSAHLKQYTITGTHPLPEWLKIFSKEHHREERKMYNTELNLTDYQEELLEGRSLGRGGNTTKATKQVSSGG